MTKMHIRTILFALLALASLSAVRSEEPAQLFLQQLRSNKLFKIAHSYLDRIEKGAPAPEDVRSAIDLEHAQVYLEAAGSARSTKQLEDTFVSAEAALKKFLDGGKEHKRYAEARLKLGKMQLKRGVILMSGKDVDDAVKEKARLSFTGAISTFDEIVTDLRGKLEAMQGNKTTSDDRQGLALRDQYRKEYLQAMLLGGDVRERTADTLPTDSPERKKQLGQALERYKELAEKHSIRVPGAMAAFYIGRVQEKVGDKDAALLAYKNTLKQPEHDELRASKTEAAALAIKIMLEREEPQYKGAIAIGKPWMDSLRPNERRSLEWQQLRTALGKAYLGQSESEKPADAKKNKNAARSLLVAASKIPGPHLDEARQLLASVGVETQAEEALPIAAPESFADALVKGKELVEQAKTSALPLQIIKDRLASNPANKDELQAQIDSIEEDVLNKQKQASAMFLQGLALANTEDTQESINEARFYLAWTESQRKRFWEAAVIGEFVARRFPSDVIALQCGLVALTSYQGLLQNADEAKQLPLRRKLEPLAKFLIAKWPDDPNAAAAASLLIQVALLDSRWADAQQYLDNLPKTSPQRAKFENLLGQFLWNEYSEKLASGDDAAASQALEKCKAQLKAGLEITQAAQVDGKTLLSALLLSRALMLSGDAKGALQVLEDPKTGPLAKLKDGSTIEAPNASFLSDTYRTALQAIASQLGGGDAGDKLLVKAADYMSGLRKAMEGQPNAEKKLVGIYFGLAKDIRKQIDDAGIGKKQKLIEGFGLFLTSMSEQSSDTTSLNWVAQTFIEMGGSLMGDSDPPATGQAKEQFEQAAKTLGVLLERDDVEPSMKRQIRFQLGTTYRYMAEYSNALSEFDKILKENNTMIDAQKEAALAYQQWARVVDEKYAKSAFTKAMSGAKTDPATGKNTIWGWGRLAKLAMSNPQFKSTFFEARFRLAECRFLIGQRSTVVSDKKKYADAAEKDILATMQLYPELGGDGLRKKYDQLMRQIQQAQGKAPTGLPS